MLDHLLPTLIEVVEVALDFRVLYWEHELFFNTLALLSPFVRGDGRLQDVLLDLLQLVRLVQGVGINCLVLGSSCRCRYVALLVSISAFRLGVQRILIL